MPTIELSSAARAYGARVGVPVALDIRDLRPDHVVHRVPAVLRTAVRLGFAPYRHELTVALRRARAVYGIAEPYLRWGLDLAGRTRRPTDHIFPLANDWRTSTPAELDVGRAYWRSLGVHPASAELTCCFFGQMSRNLPLADVISAAKLLKVRGSTVKTLLIGDGPLKARWQTMAQDHPDIIMPGWLGRAELEAALQEDLPGAKQHLEQAGRGLPKDDVELWIVKLELARCKFHLLSNRPEDALQHLERAMHQRAQPTELETTNDAKLHEMAARVYRARGQVVLAHEQIERARELLEPELGKDHSTISALHEFAASMMKEFESSAFIGPPAPDAGTKTAP